jgi:hypothetical protein
MRVIENLAAEVEQRLNPVDYIPVASSFSGIFRIYLGAAEVAASVAFIALNILGVLFLNKGKMRAIVTQGLNYSLHGIGNVARGAIAMLTGINLLLFVYDLKIGRMNYDQEELRPHVYPIMTAHRLAH